MKKKVFIILLGVLFLLSVILLPLVVTRETTLDDIYSNTYNMCMGEPSLNKSICVCISQKFNETVLNSKLQKNDYNDLLKMLKGSIPFDLKLLKKKLDLDLFEQKKNQCIAQPRE